MLNITHSGIDMDKNEVFAIGQSFDETYPPEAAVWCNEHGAYIERRGTQFVILAVPKPELEDIKSTKLSEINTTYQQAIATLTPTYPDDERLTFDKQEQEARAWMADNSTPTPFVDALAAGRQMKKAELVSRIIAKADAFALASGSLTGQRQRYEDMLKKAETAEAVAAIVPEYSLPNMKAQA